MSASLAANEEQNDWLGLTDDVPTQKASYPAEQTKLRHVQMQNRDGLSNSGYIGCSYQQY
jgi:hypothetical protein